MNLINSEVALLQKENKKLRDKWIRAVAELENHRKRDGDEIAKQIAKKLREKKGKFQLMRETVAEWIEEGKWKDG